MKCVKTAAAVTPGGGVDNYAAAICACFTPPFFPVHTICRLQCVVMATRYRRQNVCTSKNGVVKQAQIAAA